jgi:hypothetical protein
LVGVFVIVASAGSITQRKEFRVSAGSPFR